MNGRHYCYDPGGHDLYIVLVCICLCCFLPPCQEEVLCSLFSVLSKKVPAQGEAADCLKFWRLLIGGIQLTGTFKSGACSRPEACTAKGAQHSQALCS